VSSSGGLSCPLTGWEFSTVGLLLSDLCSPECKPGLRVKGVCHLLPFIDSVAAAAGHAEADNVLTEEARAGLEFD